MLALPGSTYCAMPVNCEPFPTKKGATTLPRAFTCPLTATFPPAKRVFPTFPVVPISVVTFAKVPITFPVMSILAADGSDEETPDSKAPFPRKYTADTFPVAVTLPRTSAATVAGSVAVTPVSRAPLPRKYAASALPLRVMLVVTLSLRYSNASTNALPAGTGPILDVSSIISSE